MSRIGRLPIEIPANVTVDLAENNVVIVTGPLGTLREEIDTCIKVEKNAVDGKNFIVLSRNDETREVKAKHGLYRALIHNMVVGVTKGYEKTLIVNGVGYKCSVSGNKLVMNIGFSHPVNFEFPNGIKITCPDQTTVKVEGIDKEVVGQVAADIKAIKPVEPYHAYGIRYADQYVLRKEAKKATKKK